MLYLNFLLIKENFLLVRTLKNHRLKFLIMNSSQTYRCAVKCHFLYLFPNFPFCQIYKSGCQFRSRLYENRKSLTSILTKKWNFSCKICLPFKFTIFFTTFQAFNSFNFAFKIFRVNLNQIMEESSLLRITNKLTTENIFKNKQRIFRVKQQRLF